MRSMKTLLRLLGAVSLTTVAASSVVACGSKAPDLNVDVAKLLDWYDAQGNSKIEQLINYDANELKISIDANDFLINNLIKVPELFKTKLLIQGSSAGKFKAKNPEATKFLSDLNFKSGDENKDYSETDVTSITALIAKVTSSSPGKIEENSSVSDFKVAAGTCQIDIMDKVGEEAKVVKSYTIKTLKNNNLQVSNNINSYVTIENLNFTKEKGYVQGGKVLTSLPWKDDKSTEKNAYDALITLFSKYQLSLVWSSDTAGQTVITTYPTGQNVKAYLYIKIGNIKLMLRTLDCGNLPPA